MRTLSTPLYRKQLSESGIINICKHLVEKRYRSIEQITGHYMGTTGRLLEDMADHAVGMNEHPIKTIGLAPVECDELWRNAQKTKKCRARQPK
jgi:hypothetical protein